jgi:ABC-type dipeptide/oligopeptide/nickel transport system permease component
MAAYLIRRMAYGALTVLGVLLLLFVLFFAVTDPDDIARKAVGERARPEVYAQWKKNHGYDRPLAPGSGHWTDNLFVDHFRRMLTFDFGKSDADSTPILERVKKGIDLGTRATYADLGQTLAEVFELPALANGTSFLPDIRGPA